MTLHSLLIQVPQTNFEFCSQKTASGVDFWFGGGLQKLLTYPEGRNFLQVIEKGQKWLGVIFLVSIK